MMLQNKIWNVTNCQSATPSVWAWLASQQAQPQRPPGSGMRAVSTKRESTGTGVFLPCQTRAPTEPFKKHEIMYRQSVMMAQQRQQPTQVPEFRLSQEWTY
ncbi:hypothetical protein HanXRQr2_Chr13g0616041 [Helianthus annuus]|uniref:Uncharacterized protein n=1 Tax=Helianthus annuus TaxID=4232 RepID=A0A9K3HEG8_HELAN|nr:uncharacterized protein LOC110900344 [Helianthus annuus]KAF5775794.1 hypothetical protein HanXRQr2_Chr13g0616041 [Helianthus annuus]